MITKKKLLQTIKGLPESFSIDELMDKVVFLQKIEMGLEQSEKKQIHTGKEAKGMLKKWLK